jgi:predicted AlkP superfamily phosphohydrolase/phosphomutase
VAGIAIAEQARLAPQADKARPAPDRVFAPAPRPLRAVADRILIIGLDGATFDVLDPLMAAGRMPNFRRFCETGVAGVLMSTRPPITPAAWTTFMTGKGPGRHGILDFETYDAATHTLAFNSCKRIREKTIWDILSEKRLRVGSINVPMTFPPKEVNGFMISGFETPSINADFTWPRELKDEIFRVIPNYNYRTNWRRKAFGGDAQLVENLDYISSSFWQGLELTRHCGEKFGWDVLMVLFKLVDNLQHKAWKYLDPRTSGRYPRRAEMAAQCFKQLDLVLGELFEYAERRRATVLIMSDHGHGSLDAKTQPNLLLKSWGYLSLRSGWERATTRAGHMLHRLTKRKATRFEQGSRGIERELAVNWLRTRACVMHAGIYGFLYVNLQGRGPYGIVPPAEYERVRDDLIERFGNATTPDRHGDTIRIFPNVYKTEELYNCSREENASLPDLLLAPHPGFAVVRKIRGGDAVRWCPDGRLEGTHREEGIVALGGPNIRAGERVNANIIDIAPTVLSALGLRVPLDMEGRVLREVFSVEPCIEREPPLQRVLQDREEVYSEADKRILEKRLSELGYLE